MNRGTPISGNPYHGLRSSFRSASTWKSGASISHDRQKTIWQMVPGICFIHINILNTEVHIFGPVICWFPQLFISYMGINKHTYILQYTYSCIFMYRISLLFHLCDMTTFSPNHPKLVPLPRPNLSNIKIQKNIVDVHIWSYMYMGVP